MTHRFVLWPAEDQVFTERVNLTNQAVKALALDIARSAHGESILRAVEQLEDAIP